MLKYIKGTDYTVFDHVLFVGLVQAQFPGAEVSSEGDNPNLGTPGFVTVNLPEADHTAVLAILTTGLPAAIAAQQLAQAKAQACASITAAMNATMYGLFTDSVGNTWQVDQNSRALMTGTEAKIASGMLLPDNFAWLNLANLPVSMTATSFKALTAATFAWTQNVFAASLQAKAAVMALTTVAAVQTYPIPAWPVA